MVESSYPYIVSGKKNYQNPLKGTHVSKVKTVNNLWPSNNIPELIIPPKKKGRGGRQRRGKRGKEAGRQRGMEAGEKKEGRKSTNIKGSLLTLFIT